MIVLSSILALVAGNIVPYSPLSVPVSRAADWANVVSENDKLNKCKIRIKVLLIFLNRNAQMEIMDNFSQTMKIVLNSINVKMLMLLKYHVTPDFYLIQNI